MINKDIKFKNLIGYGLLFDGCEMWKSWEENLECYKKNNANWYVF